MKLPFSSVQLKIYENRYIFKTGKYKIQLSIVLDFLLPLRCTLLLHTTVYIRWILVTFCCHCFPLLLIFGCLQISSAPLCE